MSRKSRTGKKSPASEAHRIVWGGIRRAVSTLLLLTSCVWLPANIHATDGPRPEPRRKADRFLRERAETGTKGATPVIVTLKSGDLSQRRIRLGGRDHDVRTAHPLIGAFSTEVNIEDLGDLEADPNVAGVSLDAPISASATMPNITLDMARAELGVSTATNAPAGSGIRVAIIDSGIASVGDLGPQIVAFYDFTNGGKSVAPYDDYGHGTHIAGIIGSSGAQTGGKYKGVAPKVTFVGLKVLDAAGMSSTSTVIAALSFATTYKAQLGIDIINLSLGHPIFEPAATDPLVQAVEQAVRAGIVVVVSAGNFGISLTTGQPGYAGIASPGNAPSAITVGATQTQGTLDRSNHAVAPYSSRGPSWYDGFAKPDVVAPGHGIVSNATSTSTLAKLFPSWMVAAPTGGVGPFMRLSGTSMATAVVTGVVAQVLEVNRTRVMANGSRMTRFNPYVVKAVLEYTASTIAGADTLTQGAGEVNAAGALDLINALDTSVKQPWAAGALGQTTTIGGQSFLWSRTLVWGSSVLQSSTPAETLWAAHLVWGTNLAWGNNVVSGNNVVWGSNVVWANNVVWGNNIVWSNNIVWGSNVVWGNSIVSSNNIIWGNTVGW